MNGRNQLKLTIEELYKATGPTIIATHHHELPKRARINRFSAASVLYAQFELIGKNKIKPLYKINKNEPPTKGISYSNQIAKELKFSKYWLEKELQERAKEQGFAHLLR